MSEVEELKKQVEELKKSYDSAIELTFTQRTINEKNKQVLTLLIDVLEALPLNPETTKVVKSLSNNFRKMAYTKLES